MRHQRKAEARAVAAVIDADALAEQEAKALELQVRGILLWCAQHSPTLVPQHELLLQWKQQATGFVWTVVGPRLNVQSLCRPSQQTLYWAHPLLVNHGNHGCDVWGPLSGCSLQTGRGNQCTMCLWAAWLRLLL